MPRRSAGVDALRHVRPAASQLTANRPYRPQVRSPRQSRGAQLAPRFECHQSSSSSQAHLTTSAPFQVRERARIRPVIRHGRRRGQPLVRFPVAFRPPAFASWSAFPAGGLGSPHGRLTGPCRQAPNEVSTLHAHEMRPARAPSLPRGLRCPHDWHRFSSRRAALLSGQPLDPGLTTRLRGWTLRGVIEGSRSFTRPAFPLPVAPGWTGALKLPSELRTPPLPGAHEVDLLTDLGYRGGSSHRAQGGVSAATG